MYKNNKERVPASFWLVAIGAVVWNLLGVMAYFMEVTMSDEAMAALPDAQQALYAAQPGWVTGAFAIAVFAGLGGSILLVIRNCLATVVFAVSLFAVLLQMFYLFFMSDTLTVMGTSSAILPMAIVIIGATLIWYSARANRKGWTD